MYIHLFSAAVIPAQVYIFYGIALENSTDWIKWSLQGLGPVSFIGGFRVSDSEMETSAFLEYSIEMTRNTGVATCIMLGCWLIYGIMVFFKKYIMASSE